MPGFLPCGLLPFCWCLLGQRFVFEKGMILPTVFISLTACKIITESRIEDLQYCISFNQSSMLNNLGKFQSMTPPSFLPGQDKKQEKRKKKKKKTKTKRKKR